MTVLRLSAQALARSRFALSPLAETLGAMRVLLDPCTDPWVLAWHTEHAPTFRAALDADPFAHGLLGLAFAGKWLPSLVVHPPEGGMTTTLASELQTLAATPDEAVLLDLRDTARRTRAGDDLAWLDGHGWAPRVADLLQQVWTRHVQPDWPRRRALLERDVTHRAGLLAAHGWPRALERMSRRSAWVGTDTIRFSDQSGPDRVVGPDGMLFIPVSTASGTWLCEGPGQPHALVYPARGAATTEPPAGDGALDRLVGGGRARLLRELDRPATPTELAAALAVSLGTVGGHLGVLRDAGLVAGTRSSRRVIYRRTELGDQLVTRAPRHHRPQRRTPTVFDTAR